MSKITCIMQYVGLAVALGSTFFFFLCWVANPNIEGTGEDTPTMVQLDTDGRNVTIADMDTIVKTLTKSQKSFIDGINSEYADLRFEYYYTSLRVANESFIDSEIKAAKKKNAPLSREQKDDLKKIYLPEFTDEEKKKMQEELCDPTSQKKAATYGFLNNTALFNETALLLNRYSNMVENPDNKLSDSKFFSDDDDEGFDREQLVEEFDKHRFLSSFDVTDFFFFSIVRWRLRYPFVDQEKDKTAYRDLDAEYIKRMEGIEKNKDITSRLNKAEIPEFVHFFGFMGSWTIWETNYKSLKGNLAKTSEDVKANSKKILD